MYVSVVSLSVCSLIFILLRSHIAYKLCCHQNCWNFTCAKLSTPYSTMRFLPQHRALYCYLVLTLWIFLLVAGKLNYYCWLKYFILKYIIFILPACLLQQKMHTTLKKLCPSIVFSLYIHIHKVLVLIKYFF
jgi:hypothetical protein